MSERIPTAKPPTEKPDITVKDVLSAIDLALLFADRCEEEEFDYARTVALHLAFCVGAPAAVSYCIEATDRQMAAWEGCQILLILAQEKLEGWYNGGASQRRSDQGTSAADLPSGATKERESPELFKAEKVEGADGERDDVRGLYRVGPTGPAGEQLLIAVDRDGHMRRHFLVLSQDDPAWADTMLSMYLDEVEPSSEPWTAPVRVWEVDHG